MLFLHSLSPEDLNLYHGVVSRSVEVRNHLDALMWLQGDMQRFLPHDILVAAWGDFHAGAVQHDVISPLAGVRSTTTNPVTITPLLVGLFRRWESLGKKPLGINAGDAGFLLEDNDLQCALGSALLHMRSAMVHGICDERGSHDCLYVTFSRRETVEKSSRSAMDMVLPYIDIALRQVEHLPHQSTVPVIGRQAAEDASAQEELDLSDRELQILRWVAMGKTNSEIGMILDISAFTVKNHLQRVFKKLNVTNRAQAVGKFQASGMHV